jgi:hypothetical protein
MKNLTKVTKDIKMNSRACLTGLILTFTAIPVMAGTITGTKHDFSSSGWSGGEICIACHTPHNANSTVTDAPLWNHNLSAVTTYSLYSSPTLNATTAQPTGTSKLCLSCHDGTVAYDNTAAGTKMTGSSAVGSDGLSNDHPISFDYNSTLATNDGALHNPATKTVTIGSGTDTKSGTIASVMLIGGQVQCATCHDVHNKFTAAIVAPATSNKLLRVSNAGSGLCLTCHNK